MGIKEDIRSYRQSHSGGMQPVTTIGEKLEAAYIAGASRMPSQSEIDAEARIIVEEVYGPGEPEQWQLENAHSALMRIYELRANSSQQ